MFAVDEMDASVKNLIRQAKQKELLYIYNIYI